MNACVECFSRFISPSLSLLQTLRESAAWKLSCCSLLRTLRFECREEVTCCSGAWLVIQLGGGAERTVELLPPMVGKR